MNPEPLPVRVTFEMDALYWAWIVNEWRVARKNMAPGWSVDDFIRSIVEAHGKWEIGNINSAGESLSVDAARREIGVTPDRPTTLDAIPLARGI